MAVIIVYSGYQCMYYELANIIYIYIRIPLPLVLGIEHRSTVGNFGANRKLTQASRVKRDGFSVN